MVKHFLSNLVQGSREDGVPLQEGGGEISGVLCIPKELFLIKEINGTTLLALKLMTTESHLLTFQMILSKKKNSKIFSTKYFSPATVRRNSFPATERSRPKEAARAFLPQGWTGGVGVLCWNLRRLGGNPG